MHASRAPMVMAAGLAIADGLHANITALTQSARNASDGVGSLQADDRLIRLAIRPGSGQPISEADRQKIGRANAAQLFRLY